MNKLLLTGFFSFFIPVLLLFSTGRPEDIKDRTDYGTFSSIEVRIPADIILEQDSICRVEADIPSRNPGDMEIVNNQGTLIIRPARKGLFSLPPEGCRLILFMPRLEGICLKSSGRLRSRQYWDGDEIFLKTEGSADMEITSLQSRKIRIIQRGSGNILASVHTEELETRQFGSGDLFLSGQAGQAVITTSGSGNFNGEELLTGPAGITISGSGDVHLQEGSRLQDIRIIGSGSFSCP